MSKYVPISWILISDLVLVIILVGIVLLSGYSSKIAWEQTKYVITKDKVTAYDGDNQKTYGLRGYTSMKLEKSLVQRICKSGKITLFFMGGGSVELNNIENPENIIDRFEKLLQSN